MRAKMSQIESNRQAADVLFQMRGYAADPDYLTIYPDLAVAEVRAILAETEPIANPGHCRRIGDERNKYSLNGFETSDNPFGALAESLTAFVDA